MITPEEAVEAIDQRFGRHPGRRALHAKGSFYRATFNPTVDASRLTRAAHMQGQPVDATVRFSNGSGDPSQPDNVADVRGMAVTFHLPDGSRTDISAQSVARFPFSTQGAFIEFVRVSDRSVGSLWRLALFLARHPRVLPTLNVVAEGMKPPTSYAAIPYYAVHAFKWVDSSGGARYVRYRWDPEESEPGLAKLEARSRGADYLQEELRQRLSQGPIQFSLILQIAGKEDPVDDPAAVWADDRESVIAGTLTVTDPQSPDETNEPIVFDPTRVTDGIEPSNDPVLQFRPRAYALSAQRRTDRA